jgi:hypothetical protein
LFVLAPDIENQLIWVTSDGGANWMRNDGLRERVTDGGRLLIYDGHPYHMQVTDIAFSPYERNLIVVGTRDAGVIYSDDRGRSWTTVPGSRDMRYVTGFFFDENGFLTVSTYGRGLWRIDMRRRTRPFGPPGVKDHPICGFNFGDCIVRLPPDPRVNVVNNLRWHDYDVLVVLGGRITGLTRSNGRLDSISISSGASYRFYSAIDTALPELTESDDLGELAKDPAAQFALGNKEVIAGLILKGGELAGVLARQAEFATEQKALPAPEGSSEPADKPDPSQPYLAVSTRSPTGPGMVQDGGSVRLSGRGFDAGSSVEVLLDGKAIGHTEPGEDGRVRYELQVESDWTNDWHRVEMVQKTARGVRRAASTVIKVREEDEAE